MHGDFFAKLTRIILEPALKFHPLFFKFNIFVNKNF